MLLSELTKNIEKIKEKNINPKIDPSIKNICYDSRKINHGDLFIAIKGFKKNGHDFIETAVKKGASAIIAQKLIQINNSNVPQIIVKNTRKCLAEIACAMNNNPTSELITIGITGTNGKTTTSYIVENMIKKSGYIPGVIGSINQRFKLFSEKNISTTPESLELQNIMRKMLKSGVKHVVIEVSSHALDLYRVHKCEFDIAVFTNLTQDHLDYHINMEKYWNVKQKLFDKHLKKNATSVVNIDDYRGRILAKKLSSKRKVITTGETRDCDIYPLSLTYKSTGIEGKIKVPNGNFDFHSSLLGNFNLNNILSATGVGVALGIPLIDLTYAIKETSRVPGRLELVDNSIGIPIYIDYAHTPDALENVLNTIRCVNTGRIITIFGCGGDRDTSKRKLMGEITATLSDLSIITSDNPRFEDPMKIAKDITRGINRVCRNYINPKKLLLNKSYEKGYTIILDREKAILAGILISMTRDTILITGKGHEQYQIVGSKSYKFDEKEKIKKIIATIK